MLVLSWYLVPWNATKELNNGMIMAIVIRLILLGAHMTTYSLSKQRFSCSLNGHIGPSNHVDYWDKNGQHILSMWSNLLWTSCEHMSFLVSVPRSHLNHSPLKSHRCPYFCYVDVRHVNLKLRVIPPIYIVWETTTSLLVCVIMYVDLLLALPTHKHFSWTVSFS